MKTPDAPTLEHLITNAMHADDWATVQDLEPRLDAVTQPKDLPPLVSAALYYAELGLHVFPLQRGKKVPYWASHGLKEATTDRDTILTWWTRQPQSNIGIATGHLVDVIDVDGPQGVIAWAKMKNLPACIGTVSTPRYGKTPRGGGNHLYIKATGKGNGAALFPGVDYRGLGGYVVAPPSVMPDDTRYRWRQPLILPQGDAGA